MGVGRPRQRCRWVRDRLALTAGGELTGSDRRSVERHLIACDGCRRHERSLAGALGALRAAAAEAPVGSGPGAASLWPALARQIRESRHAPTAPPPLFETLAGLWDDFRARPRPALAAALALALTAGAGAGLWTHGRLESARAAIAEAARPVAPAPDPLRGPALAPGFDPSDLAFEYDLDLSPPSQPPPVRLSAATAPPRSRAKGGSASDDVPVARVDFDLDHGIPMGLDPRDLKSSY